jgi:hypothetical protein
MRPERLMEMLNSWERTRSDGNDMVIYLSSDDPRLDDYSGNLFGKLPEGVRVVIDKRRTPVEAENHCACELYKDYDYYHEINDDHVYHTLKWDDILVGEIEKHGGWGMSCGNKDGLPSGLVMSGNIVRTLGYFVTPLLEQSYADDYFVDLGTSLGMFYRVDGVDIEHKHWLFGKALPDENYRDVTNPERMARGFAGLKEWREIHKQRDIEKVLNACRGNH